MRQAQCSWCVLGQSAYLCESCCSSVTSENKINNSILIQMFEMSFNYLASQTSISIQAIVDCSNVIPWSGLAGSVSLSIFLTPQMCWTICRLNVSPSIH